MGMGWVVAVTQHAMERIVAETATSLGMKHYNPKFLVREIQHGRIVRRSELLFPGYLLVKWNSAWATLLGTRGVIEVLRSSDGDAARVKHVEIKNIKAMEDEHGFIVLPDAPPAVPLLGPGDAVRIGCGSFAGRTGIIDSSSVKERVFVLLHSLVGGNLLRVQTRKRDLLPA